MSIAMEFPQTKRFFHLSVLLNVVIIASSVLHVSLAACSNTLIKDGETNVTDNVCLEVFGPEKCQDFAQSRNVSLLPLSNMRGESVQRPGSMEVDSGYDLSLSGKQYYANLIVKWGSPSSDIGKKYVTGFLISIEAKSQSEDTTPQKRCALLSIDHSKYASKKLSFEHKMKAVSILGGKYYRVSVYSLPLSERPGYMNVSENYQYRIVFAGKTKERNIIEYPQDWVPSINIGPNKDDKSITVEFKLLEGELRTKFGFTNFTIFLLKMPEVDNAYRMANYYVPTDSPLKVGSHRFMDVPAGDHDYYLVKVKVIDNFPRDKVKCMCYTNQTFGTFFLGKDCELQCGVGKSGYFDMRGNVYEKPPPTPSIETFTTTSATTSTTTHSRETTGAGDKGPSVGSLKNKGDDSSMDKSVIIGIGISVAVLFVILVAVIGYFLYRKCKSDKRYQPPSNKGPPTKGGDAELKKVTFQPRRKRVYLLYSPDHEYHQALIKEFVSFLQTHCLCDVVEPFSSDSIKNPGMGGGAGWLADELCRCDYIIYVDSMGAYRRLEVFLKPDTDERYVPLEVGPEGDLFNLGLMYIYNKIQEMNKQLVVVSFTQEYSKNRLFKANEYLLPKRLTPFLQYIHKIGSDHVEANTKHLPLNQGCLPKLPEGMSIQEAIKGVQDYEVQNPNWFDQYFELEKVTKPILDRPLSNQSEVDSGRGSDFSKRSASPAMDSSCNSSPSSDFDFPKFPMEDAESCITITTHSDCVQDVGIVPPMDRCNVNADNFSMALQNLNQNQKDKVKDIPNQGKILPPRSDMFSERDAGIKPPPVVSSADGFSAVLQNMNRQHNTVKDKKQIILPPRADMDEVENDNVSDLLRAINFKQPSPPMPVRHANDTIKPPPLETDITSDTFSNFVRVNNDRLKDSFVPSNNVEDHTKISYEDEEKGSACTFHDSVATVFV